MNPLDVIDVAFQMTLANPNPKSSRNKDGPRYFIQFEVDEETHANFMRARETKGMVIECDVCRVTGLNEPEQGKAAAPQQPAMSGLSEPSGGGSSSSATESDTPKRRRRLGPLCEQAVNLCRNENFQMYASSESMVPNSEEGARAYLLARCEIKTRKMLDKDPAAADRLKTTLQEFEQWKREILGATISQEEVTP